MITGWLTDPYRGNRISPFPGISKLFIFFFLALAFISCNRPEKSYYSNGQLKFELDKNEQGKLEGVARFWYESGKPQLTAEYVNGVLNGKLIRYREDGTRLSEDIYVAGKLNGMCRTFHYNDNVQSELPYVNDTLHGYCRHFDDVGMVMIEGKYEHSYYEGIWKWYNRSGQLTGKADFRHGTGLKISYDGEGNENGSAEYMDNLQHGKEVWVSASGKSTRIRYFDHGDVVEHEVPSPLGK
jgi:antitoxin component YwqK of YwqJK toxin-antitoxin module